MIEKNNYSSFQKKITPYLDGSLSQEEAAEFEAFVLTHPEFEEKINTRKQEIEKLKSMIPVASMSRDAREAMEHEFRTSVYNLLKVEPKSFWDSLRLKMEEWFSR